MNINEMNKGIEDIKKIRISDSERRAIFNNVLNTPIASPYISRPNIWSFMQKPFAYALASFVVFILAGGGITYASQYTLPGDLLYPVKINISEPIKDVMAFTPKSRAEREAIKASNRIYELEQLIEKNRLTPEYSALLEDKLDKNIEKFDKNINEIGTSTDQKSEDLKLSFEKSIRSHSKAIDKFSKNNEKINRILNKIYKNEEMSSSSDDVKKNKPNGSSIKNYKTKPETESENSVNIDYSGRLEYDR